VVLEDVARHPYCESWCGPTAKQPAATQDCKLQTGIFDLGVRHVMLGNGELYYNDRKSGDVDVLNQFQAGFRTGLEALFRRSATRMERFSFKI
jgi:hypothetical protein